jgi:hypothetical protein
MFRPAQGIFRFILGYNVVFGFTYCVYCAYMDTYTYTSYIDASLDTTTGCKQQKLQYLLAWLLSVKFNQNPLTFQNMAVTTYHIHWQQEGLHFAHSVYTSALPSSYNKHYLFLSVALLMKTKCVLCEAGNKFSHIIQLNFLLWMVKS